MNFRYRKAFEALDAAKDAGDTLMIAICRRVIVADRLGWKRHGDNADFDLILDFLGA